MARRLELARMAAARTLREGTPAEYRTSLASVGWARVSGIDTLDVAFAPAQVAQLESIVRALSGRDRLRPLLAQVLDTMVLWTGVERGLLLLRAPNGRLVPRSRPRNLARRDLTGEHLVLSQTIARRAVEEGAPVVATDAFSTLGDVHASVHALRLRSVLAVPLIARGETVGVVYLDDRVRKGAFWPARAGLGGGRRGLGLPWPSPTRATPCSLRRAVGQGRARPSPIGGDAARARCGVGCDANAARARAGWARETRFKYDGNRGSEANQCASSCVSSIA